MLSRASQPTSEASTAAISSGAHPRKLDLFHLPGEIRTQVYDRFFDDCVVEIKRNHPNTSRRYDNDGKDLGRLRRRLTSQRIPFVFSDRRLWGGFALLLSCRQVYLEALTLLYTKTTFRFCSPKSIDMFLNIIPSEGLQAVKHLELEHETYGEPELTKDREWKIRHDKRWMKTCQNIAEKITNLETLKLDLCICDWPTQLNHAARWAKPILLLKHSGLKQVDAVLAHNQFSDRRLASASRALEYTMMNDAGKRAKQHEEDMAEIMRMESAKARSREKSEKETKSHVIATPRSPVKVLNITVAKGSMPYEERK